MIRLYTIFLFLALVLVPIRGQADSKFKYETGIFTQEDYGYTVKVEYPRVTDQRFPAEKLKSLNKMIHDYVAGITQNEVKDFADSSNEIMAEIQFPEKDTLNVSYEIKRFDEEYLSVKFDVYYYGIGAAHGMNMIYGLNYDLRNDKFVALGDLFIPQTGYLEQVSNFSRLTLMNKLGEGSYGWINDGTAPLEEKYDAFGIGERDVYIYFSPYEVACYAAGAPEITIPFTNLAGLKE